MYNVKKELLKKLYKEATEKKEKDLQIFFKNVPEDMKSVYSKSDYTTLEFSTDYFEVIFKSPSKHTVRYFFYEDIRMLKLDK